MNTPLPKVSLLESLYQSRSPEDRLRLQQELEESKRRERERLRLEQEDPRFVITMVHGTWAKKATWILPDSRFGKDLRMTLAPAHIAPFRWSGGNSWKARIEASEELRCHLVELRKRFPNAHHAVVAHSHGGNVALMTLSEKELAASILGLAALGTPFLTASLLERESLLGPVEGFVAAAFSGIAVFALGFALGHGRHWWLAALLTFAAILGTLALAALVAKLMHRHAKRVSQAMPATRLSPEQVAIIRAAADEAAGAISGARVAGAAAVLFWKLVSSPVVQILRSILEYVDYLGLRKFQEEVWRRADYTGGFGISQPDTPAQPKSSMWEDVWKGILPLLPTIILSLMDSKTAVWRWLAVALMVGYGLPAIAALIVNVASLPFTILFALGLLPCGWSLPLAGPYLDLTAEPCPPGTWSVTQLENEELKDGSLSHGYTHDDPRVFEFVGKWLRKREAAAKPLAAGTAFSSG